jgi:hypothetical protein
LVSFAGVARLRRRAPCGHPSRPASKHHAPLAESTTARNPLPAHISARRGASWLNDLVPNSDHHSLGAGHGTKLWTEMLDVFFDGSAADVKRLANLPG